MVLTPEYLKGVTPQEAVETMKAAQIRRREDNRGYSKSKELRHIGFLPFWVFHLHPEFWTDDKALRKWMKTHAEELVTVRKI